MNFGSVEARPFDSLPMPAGREGSQAVREWRVVHACESLRQVLPVVEAQAAAGIKPYVLTPQGKCVNQSGFRSGSLEAPKPVSLLKAWSEVRNWRRNFLNSEVETGVPATDADLLHAHCFSAGMTAVRNSPAVVYSLYDFIENMPHVRGQKDHSWLARSFAVAEQFVCTRAGAVVVDRGVLRDELLRRGCAAENVFLIPPPLSAEVVDFLVEPQSALPKRKREDGIVFFAPDICFPGAGLGDGPGNRPKLNQSAECLFEAFALLKREIKPARLFVPATPACAAVLLEKSTALGIADSIFAISSAECGRVFAEADVIIAMGAAAAPEVNQDDRSEDPAEAPSAPEPVFSAGDSSAGHLSGALAGMIAGATLLAADTPSHRDLSPAGRGLLWFRQDDPRDLATRAAFLARNPDLCRSLAAAARKHLVETRSPQAIGGEYDAVYQHVFSHRRSSSPRPNTGRLQPLVASL